MRIYTSRYANPAIASSGLVPIGFTAGYPRFPLRYKLAANLRELGPTRSMFGLEQPEFERQYRARLDALGAPAIMNMLANVSAGQDVVLLCFEKLQPPTPGVFCHRTSFARFWQATTGQSVDELADPSTPKPRKETQPQLLTSI